MDGLASGRSFKSHARGTMAHFFRNRSLITESIMGLVDKLVIPSVWSRLLNC